MPTVYFRIRRQMVAPAFQVAGVVVVTVIVLLMSYAEMQQLRIEQQQQESLNREVGSWVALNSAPDAVFAVKDIGYAGYYSDRKILDLAGLVSPECIPYRAKGDFLGPIYKFQPDYFAFSRGQIVHLGLEKSALMKQYRDVRTVISGSGSYTIYGKISSREKEDGNSNR